ncbi:hypothetical protein A2V49_00210 [candidate division WWE3 bacterium RBG_19FT_COMBO_34_6]|uniref:Uncharacterized protein n=1 Tax=candidate division WWE3 bacterium RBG_19FT_COMBO_34_6 TaxID=1802612 RepID=A0A1F4ULK0_UNCKA|nr:MAG: hypothetical protein A2V49_00210 [candidate division WWE3 bacterium RBG_19FT_COMBO_34_6]
MSKKKLLIPATVIVIIILIIVSRNKKVEDDQTVLQNNLFDAPTISENRKVTADFQSCDPKNNLEIKFEFGKAKMVFKELSENNCLIDTMFETQGGSYTNECAVPISLGKVEFDGYNFDKISKYCRLNSTGHNLLEIK